MRDLPAPADPAEVPIRNQTADLIKRTLVEIGALPGVEVVHSRVQTRQNLTQDVTAGIGSEAPHTHPALARPSLLGAVCLCQRLPTTA